MKSLICEKPFEIHYIETPKPVIKNDEVLLKIKAVGVCGTDIHAYTGNQPFFSYPRILGHEICGLVEAVGNDCPAELMNQYVVVIPAIACGECVACKEGKTNCCDTISLYGVHQDGGFQDYLAVKASNVIPVPASVDPAAASLVECFAIGAHANRRADSKQNENILVVGAGPIGLGTAAIALANGANVVLADVSNERRAHAESVLGIKTLNPIEASYTDDLYDAFNNNLACTVMDATGNKASMSNSVNLIRHGGKIVFIGLYIGDLQLDDPTFHKKETTLIASRNATFEDFTKVIDLFESKKISEKIMVNQEFQFDTIGLDYENNVVKNKGLVKGVIRFD
ncbi:zinc-binding alcohol dehydrogenase family protein [Marinomonas sp. 15G1-11]|uniref:Zinc-binding alcohol dehydrogenase family protein n=1 Tax=Marinomonas phaeophyticola TaxID=3004091 RepID=A0ABT4JRE6_9GAMM|nr:zinc-binding alcohol dehydrogenase family protein [Marinomonas sp. 15G1-11]MCZ2720924.1 zinc-binding alcohol dehydrogenase family protein [Marinomonas sp. 15G1-11]